ncbi:hypothetical protein HQ590_06165 [bacterium]|nr:hypothetical protein [bacterium]
MPVVIIILFAVIFVGIIVYGAHAKAQRRKELAAWAAGHGLRFLPASRSDLESRYPEFDCLRHGTNRYAYNLIDGDWQGRALLGFDYHYATHSTDSKGRRRTQHHHFSAVVLRSPMPLEPLLIRPEGAFDKVKQFFGFEDINFESAEFSRRFYVQAANRRWAYDVIHQRTMEFLLAQPDFHLQFGPQDAIAWRSSRFNGTEFGVAAGVIAGVLDRLPEYVIQQQRGT